MGAEHNGLLCDLNIRWLPQKKVLERVANPRDEINIFLKEQKHDIFDRFSEDKWIAELLFLADYFQRCKPTKWFYARKTENLFRCSRKH